MLKESEMNAVTTMSDAMKKILTDNDINPLQALSLIGLAARKTVSEIGCEMHLMENQAIVIALGGMLPIGYLAELKELGNPSGSLAPKCC